MLCFWLKFSFCSNVRFCVKGLDAVTVAGDVRDRGCCSKGYEMRLVRHFGGEL